MYSFATYKEQYKANLRLALPVVLTQLGQILTQVADNLMVGRYGGSDPTPLAAVSFGGAVFFILFIAAIGIALGMTPLVGELYAQGDREKSSGLLQNGILFYGLLGVAPYNMRSSRSCTTSASPPKWSTWPSPITGCWCGACRSSCCSSPSSSS